MSIGVGHLALVGASTRVLRRHGPHWVALRRETERLLEDLQTVEACRTGHSQLHQATWMLGGQWGADWLPPVAASPSGVRLCASFAQWFARKAAGSHFAYRQNSKDLPRNHRAMRHALEETARRGLALWSLSMEEGRDTLWGTTQLDRTRRTDVLVALMQAVIRKDDAKFVSLDAPGKRGKVFAVESTDKEFAAVAFLDMFDELRGAFGWEIELPPAVRGRPRR